MVNFVTVRLLPEEWALIRRACAAIGSQNRKKARQAVWDGDNNAYLAAERLACSYAQINNLIAEAVREQTPGGAPAEEERPA